MRPNRDDSCASARVSGFAVCLGEEAAFGRGGCVWSAMEQLPPNVCAWLSSSSVKRGGTPPARAPNLVDACLCCGERMRECGFCIVSLSAAERLGVGEHDASPLSRASRLPRDMSSGLEPPQSSAACAAAVARTGCSLWSSMRRSLGAAVLGLLAAGPCIRTDDPDMPRARAAAWDEGPRSLKPAIRASNASASSCSTASRAAPLPRAPPSRVSSASTSASSTARRPMLLHALPSRASSASASSTATRPALPRAPPSLDSSSSTSASSRAILASACSLRALASSGCAESGSPLGAAAQAVRPGVEGSPLGTSARPDSPGVEGSPRGAAAWAGSTGVEGSPGCLKRRAVPAGVCSG
eukprot:365325-Chlamydomonas_euryale.AAC.40